MTEKRFLKGSFKSSNPHEGVRLTSRDRGGTDQKHLELLRLKNSESDVKSFQRSEEELRRKKLLLQREREREKGKLKSFLVLSDSQEPKCTRAAFRAAGNTSIKGRNVSSSMLSCRKQKQEQIHL